MNAEDLVTLNEEIAGMARAGLPLDKGLSALAHEMARGRLQAVTGRIAEDLQAGYPLPEAIQRQGKRVPPFYAGLVTAGIRSGRLSEVMTTLTDYARSIADLRSTVLNALFYPTVVVIFAIALFSFMGYGVLPQFEEIFRQLQIPLPALTRFILQISKHPLEVLVLPFAAVLLGLFIYNFTLRFWRTDRLAWAYFIYSIPVVGTLFRSTRLAAFSNLLAILVDHGVPLPEAFRLAGDASSDPIMAAAARQVEEDLRQGMPLGEVLRSRKLVPELIAWMTAFGEQRGTLAKTLYQVAGVYRRQVEIRALFLRNVLPPFLIIATAGLLIAVFVLTIMLPMYKLLEGLSK